MTTDKKADYDRALALWERAETGDELAYAEMVRDPDLFPFLEPMPLSWLPFRPAEDLLCLCEGDTESWFEVWWPCPHCFGV